MTTVEICVEDLDSVPAIERAGADRIELCADLAEGGITPSIGTVTAALAMARTIDVHVLVRQRPGDFVYSAAEATAMVADIRAVRALNHPPAVTVGFVVGALTTTGDMDVKVTSQLVAAAGGWPVTFHKAFDETRDRLATLDLLAAIGVTRVLTAGGASNALDGSDELALLVAHAPAHIGILAGGGIRPGHAAEVVRRTGVREIHLKAPAVVAAANGRHDTDIGIVRAVIDELRTRG